MIAVLLTAGVFARDVDVKVHDMRGVVRGAVVVELEGTGGAARFEPRDDGAPPDAVAGDRLYTARATGLAVRDGAVRVRADGQTWEGGFAFDDGSDPVLLVGLEANGFAAASTREIRFLSGGVEGAAGGPPPDGPAAGGPTMAPPMPLGSSGPAALPAPGASPPPMGGVAPAASPVRGGAAASPALPMGARGPSGSANPPDGMWAGWGVLVAAVGGLAAVARAARRDPEPLPPPIAPPRDGPARAELWVGPLPDGASGPWPADGVPRRALGPGRHRPDEIVRAALLAGADVVVLADPARVEAPGEPWEALRAAAEGRVRLRALDASDS